MDVGTLRHYDGRAAELSRRYESADMSATHDLLLRLLPDSGRVLEVGCGSGRDAAFLASEGFDVTGVDASGEMVAHAISLHPELAGRLRRAVLPFPVDSQLLADTFDAVVSIATIMHVADQDLFEAASHFRRMLSPGGVLFLSSSMGRPGLVDGRDEQGRLFRERPPEELQMLFERLGFRLLARHENTDSFAREVRWFSLVFEAGSGTPQSVDQIETVISRDRKVATYKLALLRALCDIARTEHFRAKWLPDGTVSVPLGLVAEKWLLYYWPLIEAGVPQITGHEGGNAEAFRPSMTRLSSFYAAHGGLSAFSHDYRAGTMPPDAVGLLDAALNDISSAIVTGPVTHAGGALDNEGPLFGFGNGHRTARGRLTTPHDLLHRLGDVLVPAAVWREMCLIGHWVGESLVLRWAELTERICKGSVPVKDAVALLLTMPSEERDVNQARGIYLSTEGLECVWTGQPIRRSLAVDHALPFSVWRTNDLWNLLPSLPAVNSSKSDKLVSKETLVASRDRIVGCWEILHDKAEKRFEAELARSLVRNEADMKNWQSAAFSGLVESVETVALQRGMVRWSA